MRDIVILAVTAAFFGLCVAYVRWCDHIIGPDPDTSPSAARPFADRTIGDDEAVPT